MPWLQLFRIILAVAKEDLVFSQFLTNLLKKNKILSGMFSNPEKMMSYLIKQKVLGKGLKQQEFASFRKNLESIVNHVNVKKQINNYVKKNQEVALNKLQQKYLENIKWPVKDMMADRKGLSDEDIIGIEVNLSSSALLSGMFIPILVQQSGVFGILSLTYISNIGKSYDYFNVSKDTWRDMVSAKGSHGTGANSVFIRQYLGGATKTRKEMKQQVRTKVKQLDNTLTKYNQNKNKGTIYQVVNPNLIKEGYSKYGKYGLKKKK